MAHLTVGTQSHGGKGIGEERAGWKVWVRAEWPEPETKTFDANMQKNQSKRMSPRILLVLQ